MPSDDDGPLARAFLAYDEALAQGELSSVIALPPADLETQQHAAFRSLQACLHRLETAWPRGPTVQGALDRHLQAIELVQRLQLRNAGSPQTPPVHATVQDFLAAAVQAGLIVTDDLDQLLADLPPEQRPRSLEQVVYELVHRGYLTWCQAWLLWSEGPGAVVLGANVVVEEVGRGGMGVVYKAFDRRQNRLVALKTLHHADAAAIGHLKHEFRVLANIVHPNLVMLYELQSLQGRWFFTMELVEGRHLLDQVRGLRSAPGQRRSGSRPSSLVAEAAAGGRPSAEALADPGQFHRLRQGLRQLAEGLCWLHEAGRLHRDIKPSNVLVEDGGRVVLVDFGLAAHVTPQAEGPSQQGLGGTWEYMSPEQAEGKPLTPASDWYSVGVLLFEALCGRLPFAGGPGEVLQGKRAGAPPLGPLPAEQDDLGTLCRDLLRPDPGARPTGAEMLGRLGGSSGMPVVPRRRAQRLEAVFVGRRDELGRLAEAFARARSGRPAVAYVHGRSGIGKTALVRQFLEDLESRERVAVFRGRCYECESVPNKILDGTVDALSRHLAGLAEPDLRRLLPQYIGCLARVFPALEQLAAVRRACREARIPSDAREVRRRAVDCLRELFRRLAEDLPVVLVVDDLQWGDVDGALLLHDLFRAPDAPPVLLVGCYRSEDLANSPALATLLERWPLSVEPSSIALGPLSEPEAQDLAVRLATRNVTVHGAESEGDRSMFSVDVCAAEMGTSTEERTSPRPPRERLPRSSAADKSWAAGIAAGSEGNPYFVVELARHLGAAGGEAGTPEPPRPADLDAMLSEEIGRLPHAARELLEMVAVAGHPVGLHQACQASATALDPYRTVAMLRAEDFLRYTGGQGTEIEIWHDRIRENVVRRLEPARQREWHARLAAVLERTPETDPELLCVHFRASGDDRKASHYALVAADRAASATAFDHAAELYQLVLALGPPSAGQEQGLHRKLGDALANAGRGVEAARHYLKAAETACGAEALALRRRAADQLLRAGSFDAGMEVLETCLDAASLTLPRSAAGAIFRILRDRLWLRLRGMHFRQRSESEVPSDLLLRLDTCDTVSSSLGMIDPVRGVAFVTRHLLIALGAGEPRRLALGLGREATLGPMMTGRGSRRSERLFRIAEDLAQRSRDPYSIAHVLCGRGLTSWFMGQWRRAVGELDAAESLLRQECSGVHWEIGSLDWAITFCLFFLGELAELGRRIPRMLQDARERHDAFSAVSPGAGLGNMVWLAADRVEEARAQSAEVMGQWPLEGFHLQRVLELIGSTSVDLYAGDARQAWQRLANAWPDFRRSMQSRQPWARIQLEHLRACAALAAMGTGLDDRQLQRTAREGAGWIQRQRRSWSNPLARLVHAALAARSGHIPAAVTLVEQAIGELDAAEMGLYAAAARKRLGELVGGDRGQDLSSTAVAWMTAQGIRSPERMARLLVP